jgi:hypothetical protein
MQQGRSARETVGHLPDGTTLVRISKRQNRRGAIPAPLRAPNLGR